LLVAAIVHTADIQDRDGAPDLLISIRARFPWLRHVFADGGYAGEKLKHALQRKVNGRWRSSSDPTPPRASNCSRADGLLSAPSLGSVAIGAWQDFEKTIESSIAWLMLASVQLMTRRLANP
jgi:hypothetical protein